MSLKGTKLICLNESGEREKIIKPEGKSFRFGYYQNSDYILANEKAKSIHCEICADAFNRVIIVNYCKKYPITINGFPINNRRPLFHGSKIKIFDKEFIWEFSKNVKNPTTDGVTVLAVNLNRNDAVLQTPPKQLSIVEPAPLSEPWKLRNNSQLKRRRLSVHSFAYCIGKEESVKNSENETTDENLSTKAIIDNSEIKENIPLNVTNTTLSQKSTTLSCRRRTIDCMSPSKSTSNDKTLINSNLSIYKDESVTPEIKLGFCKTSDLLVTSYSPKTPSRRSQSFAIIKSNKNTPKSVYCTPKSVLSEHNNSNDSMMSTNLMSFSTPQANTLHSSMFLIDLTTPAIIQKTPIKQNVVSSPLLKSALKNSANKNIKSVSKIKTKFAPVLEEPNSPLNISSGNKKYHIKQSPAENLKSVRKSLSMSINVKERLEKTPNKTPIKSVLNRYDQLVKAPSQSISTTEIINKRSTSSVKTPNLELSTQNINSTIEIEDLSMVNEYEDSIIEVTDDSIYSSKSNDIISDMETPSKSILGKKVFNTPKSLIRKAIISSAKKSIKSANNSISSPKTFASLTPISSSNLKLNTTPLRRSLIARKISPQSIGKNRFSFSKIGAHNSPSLLSSTPLKTNTKLHTSLKNRSLTTPLTNKTAKKHMYENIKVSKSFVTSTAINFQKIPNNRTESVHQYFDFTNKVRTCEQSHIDEESELNQTFTVTESSDEENQLKAVKTILKETSTLDVDLSSKNDLDRNHQQEEEIILNVTNNKELIKSLKNEVSETDIVPQRILITKNIMSESDFSKNVDMNNMDEMVNHMIEENQEQILSFEEQFDKFIGKPIKTKQYSPAKKSSSPKNQFVMLNDIEAPKTDIQEWINNLSSNTNTQSNQEIIADSNSSSCGTNIPKIENPKNDEINRVLNESCSNCSNTSLRDTNVSGIGILNKTESLFSDELVISDKSENEDMIIQSTPNNKNKLLRRAAVTDFKPTRRSSRHLNKTYSCKQCITPPTIHNIKKRLDLKEVNSPKKNLKKNLSKTLDNNVSENKIDLPKKNESHNKKRSTKITRRTMGNQTLNKSKDVIQEREIISAFQNFSDMPNISQLKAKTPNEKRTKLQNNRKTLGNQVLHTSFDLESAKEQREKELAFENFNDLPNLTEVKAKTPNEKRTKILNNRKTLGNQVIDTSFDLESAKEEREKELAFENFSDVPNLTEVKAKTPNEKRTKILNNRKTLGNQVIDTSFDLESPKEEREKELAFENFSDVPNLVEIKANTPNEKRIKIVNNRKTLGNQVIDTSFDLQSAKEEREKELAFENFSDGPNLTEIKAKTPNEKRTKLLNNRKTMGNQVLDTSFDLEAAKEEREKELAFENFNDVPNLIEIKAKTPNEKRIKIQINRKTLGNQVLDTSFDLVAAKEERETELAFENFSDLPNLAEVKAKTPNEKRTKILNNRKTLGNQVLDTSFDLVAAKEERETELAFENFSDLPNLAEVKAKTPNEKRTKILNNRKTLGNQVLDTSFDLVAAKEERETELAFENFSDLPNLAEVKAKTPNEKRTKLLNNRKTLGNQVLDTSFDLEAAKEEREKELAFENFNDVPNLIEIKAKTPNEKRIKIQINRKTLGNQVLDTSFDLVAAKEERETELAFENFSDLPNLAEVKAKTPNEKRTKILNNRKTLGNQVLDTSFDLVAAKEERETELAFENFSDLPNLAEVKAKTPNEKRTKILNNRKTLGNQVLDTSFDLVAAKEEREMELAFENFSDLPNLAEVKAKTPNEKRTKLLNNRKTLGNQVLDTSFDLVAAKEEREKELAFENFNDVPNLIEIKAKTPNEKRIKIQINRKTLGNQVLDTSFDLVAAKEERETELAFENFSDLPNLAEVKAKTPNEKRTKILNNRKTLGNQVLDTSFDLEAAKEEREKELAFENFNDVPYLIEVKAKTPNEKRTKILDNRKTMGNQVSDSSFDLKVAKEEREKELTFENLNDMPVINNAMETMVINNELVLVGDSSNEVVEDNANYNREERVTQVKNQSRTKKQLHNVTEEIDVKENQAERVQAVLESTPAKRRGRPRKPAANSNDTEIEKKINIQVKGQSKTGETYINTDEKLIEDNNESEEKKEVIDSAPVKKRGRNRKQIISGKDMQPQSTETKVEDEVTENTPAKGRSKTTRLVKNNTIAEMQLSKNDDAENELIKSTPIKRINRLRKSLESHDETANDGKEEQEVIKKATAKSRVRTKKQVNNTVEKLKIEENEMVNTDEKLIEITPAKGTSRTRKPVAKKIENKLDEKEEKEFIPNNSPKRRKQLNNTENNTIEKLQTKKNEIIDTNEKLVEITPVKGTSRTRKPVARKLENKLDAKELIKNTSPKRRKQLNNSENNTIEKLQTEENEKIDTNEKLVEITPAKGTSRTRKPVARKLENKLDEKEEKEFIPNTSPKRRKQLNNTENITIEKLQTEKNEIVDTNEKLGEIIPVKGKSRTRKPVAKQLENKLDTKEEKEFIKNTPLKSRGKPRKQLNNSNEEIQVKEEEKVIKSSDEEEIVKSSSVRSRKNINHISDSMEEKEVENEKEVVSNKKRGKKTNPTVTTNEQMKLENKNEEKQIQVKALRSRTRRQNQSVVENTELFDESENSTPFSIKMEESTPKTPLGTRNRHKLQGTSNSEKSKTETVEKSPILTHGNEEVYKMLKNAKQFAISPETSEFKTPILPKTRLLPRRRISTNATLTPILNVENKHENEIGVRRSKRKAANDTDNSISEEMLSTESITKGRRRRINSEIKTSEDESETAESVKNNGGKRKLKEIPIESDVSEKRSTRRRK